MNETLETNTPEIANATLGSEIKKKREKRTSL